MMDSFEGDDSSSSNSSSEEEMEFEEDVHAINMAKEQIQELKLELEKNPYLYDKYVVLIDLLKRVKDVDQLRDIRTKMRSVYPLTEELWLQWIKEDEQFDENLFEVAIKDYISVDIWIEYAYFSMKKLNEKGGDEHVRSVFENALTHAGLHPIKGFLIWEAYREFEIVMLQSVQPTPGTVATQEQIDAVNSLTKKIEKLFTRQIALPMKGMEKTLEEFKSFINTDCSECVLNSFKKALAYWEEIRPFEDKLEKISSSNIEIYKQYIDFEISHQQPARIQCIFERAIKDNCLDVSLWLQYISYITKLGIESIVLPIHERSVRNCSWSGEIWTKYLLALERYNAPKEKVEEIFRDALQSGFTLTSDYLNLWSAYVDIIRRRIDWSSEDHKGDLDNLRTTIEKAINHLSENYGNDGDPSCSLQQYWAFIEAKYCKNMLKARELWSGIMQRGFGDQARVWLEYISIERSFGDVKHCRKVFHRAINSVSDWPENICEAFLIFERQEGTLSTFEDALTRVDAQLKRINDRRVNEAQKEVEGKKKIKKNINGEAKFNKKKDFKESKNNIIADVKPYQSKRGFSESKQKNLDNSTKMDQTLSDDNVFKKPLVFERQSPMKSNDSKMKNEFDAKSMPPPLPPKNTLKRSTDDKNFMDDLLAKKPKKSDETNVSKELKENQTIFVSNLDYSVTSEQLMEIFSKVGEIVDVRLVKNFKGKSKGYAYVEFKREKLVDTALKMDRELIDGRPMFVSRCESQRLDESKIKFNVGLEKNKLFVKNLLPSVTKETLEEIFLPFGNLKEVRIVTFRNGHSKGLAYVEYFEQASASQAVLKMDGFELNGQAISVAISNPPPRNNPQARPTSSSFVTSLGGGKKDTGRGNARTQLSFLPRIFERQKHSDNDSKHEASDSGDTSDTASAKEQMSTNNQAKMSNTDFRNMLLQK